jgi:hypothetical protein
LASADKTAAVPAAPAQVQVAQATQAQTQVPLPRSRPALPIAVAESRPAAAPKPAAPVTVASLSPSEMINARGLWDRVTEAAPYSPVAATDGLDVSGARRRLAAAMTTATAGRDVTASIDPFPRPDRGNQGSALAFADTSPAPAPRSVSPAGKGSASVINKAIDTATSRPTAERLNDPWMRGLMLTASMQNSLVVTPIGDPDYTGLVTFMRKPGSALMMTFSGDPHAGMTDGQFSGDAVVFPPTVTFGPPRRTANLQ